MTKAQISETLAGAACFCAFNRNQHLGVQAYLLALIGGIDPNAESLVAQSACYQCIAPSSQDGVLAYLIQQFTGASGTPQQIIASSPCVQCVPRSHYEDFKTYLLWTIARQDVPGTPTTPTELIDASGPLINLPPSILVSVLNFVAHEVGGVGPIVFDPTACNPTVLNGGGDKFDCYDVQEMAVSFPDAGIGFTGLWIFSNKLIGYAYRDTFNTYPVGLAGTMSNGEGFEGDWIYS